MATKRKYTSKDDDRYDKKHTLDSDEEDSDDYERENLNDSDIEGGEEGTAKIEDDVKITPFNMREELEEGHFDKDGHYHWNKDAEIKDNWLDNVDWMKVEKSKNYFDPNKGDDANSNSSDDSRPAADGAFNLSMAYTKMLEYMKAGESVQMALKRLGSQRPKLSTLEKLKRKKSGIVDQETQKISELTALANEILSKTGNMDIYEETFDKIKSKLANLPSSSKAATSEIFDMYADDFEAKESERLKAPDSGKSKEQETATAIDSEPAAIQWEFKWKLDDDAIQGPFTTEKMLNWSNENYFKTGVYVRKCGENRNFYSSNRIDFDLYL
ncbi:uncharacterized protein Dwil_GK15260 [Drosophila willistoni]|uniref:GYF domain-containing protein n=1 Tax=Drosophila willistoni TaxID=7260 RepID=B4MUC4_DROWI|nr:CD2 antigen cytoplasmic tail-binding protein 2 homolog [Drosophila willistoni]EDW76050.1 uncharacterized protein Dwil_GK15260 [Drosophila willistoni]